MDKNIDFKQIILATDGESNVGVNPVMIAKQGYSNGITISTIGIVDEQNKEEPLSAPQITVTLRVVDDCKEVTERC